MKKSTDIRVLKTQKALLEALDKLISTEKLTCITITELCSTANINRNTFYYHYNNIFELLEEQKKRIISEILDIFEKNNKFSSEMLCELLKCVRRYPHFMNILISPNCDLEYFNDIFKIVSNNTSEMFKNEKVFTDPIDLMTCYYSNAGTNAVICTWIKNGMKESPEKVAEIISNCSRKGPITLLFPEE